MVRWLYFETLDALSKWLEEVISLHERWGEREELDAYRETLKMVREFSGYLYSRKCFGYILAICPAERYLGVDVIALCKDGDTIRAVDVEEWLEYADL
jgi:hypothetical protein